MQVRSAFASVLDGLTRAERSFDGAARSVASASVSASTSEGASAAPSPGDPLEGRSVDGGDVALALVRMVAAQRAFDASLVVLRADDQMQRTMLDRTDRRS